MTERLHFPFSLSCIGEGNGNPLQYSCVENPHGQRSLVGYSPQGPIESDKQPHIQGAVAAQAPEGLEELFQVQGREGRQ